jgi:hypothetical protein
MFIGKIREEWIGPIIGVVFLILAFRNFSFNEFIYSLKDFNFYYPPPPRILCILFLSYIIRSIRWRIILDNVKRISIFNSFSVILIGQMGNNLLPARLGKIIRAYIIGSRKNISESASLIILISVVSYFLPFPLWAKEMILLSTMLFGATLIFLTICTHKTERAVDYLERLLPGAWKGNL